MAYTYILRISHADQPVWIADPVIQSAPALLCTARQGPALRTSGRAWTAWFCFVASALVMLFGNNAEVGGGGRKNRCC